MSKIETTPRGTNQNPDNKKQIASELRDEELALVSGGEIRRSTPNGRTDVIKAVGNTKW